MVYKFELLLARWAPELLGIFRIVAAFCFTQHGTQKLFGLPTPPSGNLPELLSRSGVAGILEFFGGMLLLIGLFTRPVAFVLSGLMAFAYFLVHAGRGFWTIANGGELAVIYCFAFLYMAAAGGGAFSVDNWRARSRR